MAETHHERKADRAVEFQSAAVAEYIINCRHDEIRYNIGKPPESLTDEEFMHRVGNLTMSVLTKRLSWQNIAL